MDRKPFRDDVKREQYPHGRLAHRPVNVPGSKPYADYLSVSEQVKYWMDRNLELPDNSKN